ncbi:MAG: hypothetical protein AAGA65_19090 [Actinomycetota bacterium]
MTTHPNGATASSAADLPTVSDDRRLAVAAGAAAGIVGGLAFGAAMLQLGLLPSIALLLRAESDGVGFAVHLVVAGLVGAGFGFLVNRFRPATGEILYWGLLYGAAWWLLGAMTLLPLLSGQPIGWDVASAREAFPALVGHLIYGLVAAGTLLIIRRRDLPLESDRQSLIRGVVAGLIAAVLLGLVDDGGPSLSASMADRSTSTNWGSALALGAAAGLGYGALHPKARTGAGPSLIRGLVYGFGWWIVAALTVIPLLAGEELPWSVGAARLGFATLPGYMLFVGAGVGLIHHGLTGLGRSLFGDDLSIVADEGLGTRGVRATGQGVVSGLIGGAVFTVVMIQIGFLSTVAELVGGESAIVGVVVHLLIASTIGIAYGLLFVRRSHDPGSALGWGVAYGVLWWMLGPLTLLPILLGGGPEWSVAAATDAYPALIGHIAYGAALGAAFFRLERRRDPWWVSRSEAEAARTQQASRQLLSSAPGLWALTILFALTIPVLLGGSTP